jgi:hypothetical protein
MDQENLSQKEEVLSKERIHHGIEIKSKPNLDLLMGFTQEPEETPTIQLESTPMKHRIEPIRAVNALTTEDLDTLDINPELSETERTLLIDAILQFSDIFAHGLQDLGKTHLVEHKIHTADAPPIRQRPRRMSPAKRDTVKGMIDEMLQAGIITPSESPWASPIVLVEQPNKTRLCIDYRKLNQVTKKDAYPLPRVDEILNTIGTSNYFSSLDAASGYWQVGMSPEDQEKTCFTTWNGNYQFTVMPFGLCNAPATYQRLMDSVLRGLLWDKVVNYLDDALVFANGFVNHINNLQLVFQRFRDVGLRLNIHKCHFGYQSIKILGHRVTAEGTMVQEERVEKIQHIPPPKTVTQVRSFLGLAGYY